MRRATAGDGGFCLCVGLPMCPSIAANLKVDARKADRFLRTAEAGHREGSARAVVAKDGGQKHTHTLRWAIQNGLAQGAQSAHTN